MLFEFVLGIASTAVCSSLPLKSHNVRMAVWWDGVGCTWSYVYILTTDEYPPCARGESGERYQRAPTRKENAAMTDAQHKTRDLG